MAFTTTITLLSASLFVAMILLLELGRRLRSRELAADDESARAGRGAVAGAVFGLLGLLIAFTFAGAAQRYDDRRTLVTREATAIGTAWLRLDLLPSASQPAIRDSFRSYVDARLAAYRQLRESDTAAASLQASDDLQARVWADAMAAFRGAEGGPALMLVVSALNEAFDVATERIAVIQRHPPAIVFCMLAALAGAAAFLAGYEIGGRKARHRLHAISFAAIISATFFVTIDLEFPRAGLIRVDAADEILLDARAGMK